MTSGALARAAADWPRYFDWAGACRYLSLSRHALYRLVQAGLPAIRLGHGKRAAFRFDRLRLDAWMAERAIEVLPAGSGLQLVVGHGSHATRGRR